MPYLLPCYSKVTTCKSHMVSFRPIALLSVENSNELITNIGYKGKRVFSEKSRRTVFALVQGLGDTTRFLSRSVFLF